MLFWWWSVNVTPKKYAKWKAGEQWEKCEELSNWGTNSKTQDLVSFTASFVRIKPQGPFGNTNTLASLQIQQKSLKEVGSKSFTPAFSIYFLSQHPRRLVGFTNDSLMCVRSLKWLIKLLCFSVTSSQFEFDPLMMTDRAPTPLVNKRRCRAARLCYHHHRWVTPEMTWQVLPRPGEQQGWPPGRL